MVVVRRLFWHNCFLRRLERRASSVFTATATKPMTSTTTKEYLTDVRINENVTNSRYVRLTQMQFKRGDTEMKWDMALRPDSVACVLYHRVNKTLLFVKQFRPAVYMSIVRKLPENEDKKDSDIDWSRYPVSTGETIELCAGLIDKPKLSEVAHMREEINEECGYEVPESSIKLLKKFITGIGASGSQQYLFYAEIDDTMKVGEGGGTDNERIQKVFMTVPEAKRYCEQEAVMSAPGLLYGLSWFFNQSESSTK